MYCNLVYCNVLLCARDRYTNCTYVDGNLELTWLQDENLDLSFLQHIR